MQMYIDAQQLLFCNRISLHCGATRGSTPVATWRAWHLSQALHWPPRSQGLCCSLGVFFSTWLKLRETQSTKCLCGVLRPPNFQTTNNSSYDHHLGQQCHGIDELQRRNETVKIWRPERWPKRRMLDWMWNVLRYTLENNHRNGHRQSKSRIISVWFPLLFAVGLIIVGLYLKNLPSVQHRIHYILHFALNWYQNKPLINSDVSNLKPSHLADFF